MIKEIKNFKQQMVLESFIQLDLPIISETNTLTNTYNYKIFSEFMKIIFLFLFLLKAANSITK